MNQQYFKSEETYIEIVIMLRNFFLNRFLSQPLSKHLKCSANNFRWFEKIETVQPKIILYEFGRDLQFEAFFAEAVVELFR